jgi:predicted nucleic acid-binding protein
VTGGLCLDAGALIALDRGERRVVHLLERVHAAGGSLDIPAPVLAQVWRGGRQARLARFLRADGVALVDLDAETARAVGVMCGLCGVADIVDGHVALHARRGGLAVLTSDPDDIAALDTSLRIITV